MLPGFIFFFIRTACLQLYPAYASYKAIRQNDTTRLATLLMYWIVISGLTIIEEVADVFIFWIPFYYDLKTFLLFWLILPQTQGAVYVYNNYVHPYLVENESHIDRTLSEAQESARRSGIDFGRRGFLALQKFAMENLLGAQAAAQSQSMALDNGTQFLSTSPPANAAIAAITGFGWLSSFNPYALLAQEDDQTHSRQSSTASIEGNSSMRGNPVIHPASLGTAALTATTATVSTRLSAKEIAAERARLEAALSQLNTISGIPSASSSSSSSRLGTRRHDGHGRSDVEGSSSGEWEDDTIEYNDHNGKKDN